MSERKTEKLVRDLLAANGYFGEGTVVEEQKSDNAEINRLLKGASKTGNGGKGAPEFIVSSTRFPDFLVVFECKADVAYHQSPELGQPVGFAVDGAVHYAKHLAKRYNVVAIGVSGQTKKDFRLDACLVAKSTGHVRPLLTQSGSPVTALEPLDVLHQYASRDSDVEKRRVADLMSYSRELHNFMRDYGKLTEPQKPLLISGVLIALHDEGFRTSFPKLQGKLLPTKLLQAIGDVLESAYIPQAKKTAMLQPYSFIEARLELGKPMTASTSTPLQSIVHDVNEHVYPFISTVGEDIVGRFYGEFLRYTGGDGKGLGIVLTPRHVTELFCDLADLTADDVLLDTCCGTAGFLIAGMHRMLNLPGITQAKRKAIKANQLVGVEQQPDMYALAASNMLLRGDGKANLFQDSCFEPGVADKVRALKPTVGFINPPYAQKGPGLHEFNFIESMLGSLETYGRGIAIVPMSCAVAPHPLKESILAKHTLEAVMSMPDELFYPAGTITCVMVFRAHKPHDAKRTTWFGYWKDDGFEKTKTNGRADCKNRWSGVRERWLEQYREKASVPGECVRASVTHNDEWCAEAYLETDYSKVTPAHFEAELRKFLVYKLLSPATGTSAVGGV